ncbi:hypothetical protein NOF04DRAFT_7662 [Fusarium oxysporum II5]|uniref:Uncharacterized protein n=2 Tax=Fusarium oxysporum species complex TaxID=171631 RepID=X0J6S7_FUSO5|nr:uncharacterized protein FOIG_10674 [Fusarium odoratissimum NRRL 54006]EXL96903.1 hypothetical protein FOIG_10674 [Fusarium odoratissimum NRRL 54006]KAK2129989.1 hypothetical protein NOF04DRAFT_7662 [Fusarium oxysporum II5]TXC01419.1 hypothetical protein FocTR4_00008894 [Fusarium oxysporum f. sp. cubense]
MGHPSQIEAVMEAYDDILYHYPDDGEDPLNMPKKEVIVKQKADFNYWAIHSGVCMPEIDLEHEFEREAIKGLDDFIETAHKLERLYQEDLSPNVIWLADEYVASLSQRLSQLAHTFGVLVPSLQDTGTASER